MSKIENPQNTKGKGETRGDQKEQSAPGDSAHELIEENVERHVQPKSLLVRVTKPVWVEVNGLCRTLKT